jgi:hypothetical protein
MADGSSLFFKPLPVHLRECLRDQAGKLVGAGKGDGQHIEASTENPGIDVLSRLKVALAVSWPRLLD